MKLSNMIRIVCVKSVAAVLASCFVSFATVVHAESKGSDGASTASLKNALSAKSDDESPVYITSQSLELDSKKRVFIYRDEVEIKRGELTISADKMIGYYDEKNKLETVTCENNVVVTRASELRATADRALYTVAKGIVELTEGPELERDGNVLLADKIIVFVDEDKSEAEGNVRVKVLKTDENAGGLGATKKVFSLKSKPKKPKETPDEDE